LLTLDISYVSSVSYYLLLALGLNQLYQLVLGPGGDMDDMKMMQMQMGMGMMVCSLTYLLTYALTYSLTYLLTHSLISHYTLLGWQSNGF